MISGVDVSHYQSTATLVAALRGGASFVFVKASEGTSTDPMHDTHVRTARGAGARVGHYCFARSSSSAQAEAAYFLAAAKPQPGDLLALDFEGADGTWDQRLAYALAWLANVRVATGATPLLYTNLSWRSSLLGTATTAQRDAMLSYPAWIATGGRPAGQPSISPWAIHQYSTSGGIDHDVTDVDLSQYAIPGADVPLTPSEITDIAQAVVAQSLGSSGPTVGVALQDGYARIKQIQAGLPKPVDPAALAAALAPLVHADVDPNTLAEALAPLVAPQVLQVLSDHPLVPKD